MKNNYYNPADLYKTKWQDTQEDIPSDLINKFYNVRKDNSSGYFDNAAAIQIGNNSPVGAISKKFNILPVIRDTTSLGHSEPRAFADGLKQIQINNADQNLIGLQNQLPNPSGIDQATYDQFKYLYDNAEKYKDDFLTNSPVKLLSERTPCTEWTKNSVKSNTPGCSDFLNKILPTNNQVGYTAQTQYKISSEQQKIVKEAFEQLQNAYNTYLTNSSLIPTTTTLPSRDNLSLNDPVVKVYNPNSSVSTTTLPTNSSISTARLDTISNKRAGFNNDGNDSDDDTSQRKKNKGNNNNNGPTSGFAEGGYVSSGYDPYLNTYNYSPQLTLLDYMDNQMPDSRYEDGGYGDPNMSYSNGYDDDGQQYSFKEGGSVGDEDLPKLADLIRRHGRNGDTELAHINPIEAHILKSLGGSGTINPETGLREYSFWKKPWKAIRSVIGGGAGAVIGNMIAPGIGGIIGGALGQGAQHAARGKSVLGGALKGAGMGAALPSMASGLGWGASKLGATALGSSLSNYGTTNAILPALGLGTSGGSSGLFGLGGSNPYVSGGVSAATALSSGMGRGQGQGLGVSSGDYAENYYNYMLDKQKKQDNMGFTDKLQDYLTQPGNLLTLGTTAAQYLGREKPKSPEKIAEEERRYRNASRKTIAEVEADEALETARADLQKKRKNKRLDEDIKNMGSVQRRVVSPEEFARTGRWLEYTDDEGNPVRMKGGGSARSPYTYLMEETYYPTSPIGYLSGDSGGQDDLIDARLSDGEYVFDASTVSDLGDGNNAAGARKLDVFRKNVRKHKRGGKVNLPPKAKSLESYLRE